MRTCRGCAPHVSASLRLVVWFDCGRRARHNIAPFFNDACLHVLRCKWRQVFYGRRNFCSLLPSSQAHTKARVMGGSVDVVVRPGDNRIQLKSLRRDQTTVKFSNLHLQGWLLSAMSVRCDTYLRFPPYTEDEQFMDEKQYLIKQIRDMTANGQPVGMGSSDPSSGSS